METVPLIQIADTAYLYGTTDFGDAVDDEWLIVYLLKEITKKYPDLWIRIADSDGEFLLIEAASVLPDWLNPDIDENRVWLHGGKLFIIPLGSSSASGRLGLPEALAFIRHKKTDLFHSAEVQGEAFFRLRNYPQQIQQSTHHSKVTIPRRLAYILHTVPKSISAAVEFFYLRDAKSLKPILSDSSPLTFLPEDLVTVSVVFSRTLFAQLQSQQFQTPSRWAKAWLALPDEQTPPFPILETGMKLTCGYEILTLNTHNNVSSQNHAVRAALDALANSSVDDILPSDCDIRQWPGVDRHDDEHWMDINFEDLEKELDGKSKQRDTNTTDSGFGDIKTQEDLQKMVSRFESFLSNKTAGIDGVQLDAGSDDGYETSSDEESDGDVDINFNQAEFSETLQSLVSPASAITNAVATTTQNQENSDGNKIQELSSQMETELKGHGALQINQSKQPIKNNHKGKQAMAVAAPNVDHDDTSDDCDDGDVNLDVNLVRNLLESFKGQGGASGPAGNLLGLMGFQIPRDEGEEE